MPTRGLDFALNDICLAVFTTLAPGAAFAYAALACTVLFGRLGAPMRKRLESWLIVPLALATFGLVASAAHLGTPSNALYVLRGVGSSPLATEVFCAVLFLGIAGSYWLGCVYINGMRRLRQAWLALSVAAAAVFIWGTDMAYAMPTVITWDTWLARAALPLTGLACMGPLALLVYACAGYTERPKPARALAYTSLIAEALACAVMAVQHVALGGQSNAFGTAASLVPLYPAAIVAFALCVAGANVGSLRALAPLERAVRPLPGGAGGQDAGSMDESAGEAPSGSHGAAGVAEEGRFSPVERKAIAKIAAFCLLAYAGTFAVRFCFYCFHMTSGVV